MFHINSNIVYVMVKLASIKTADCKISATNQRRWGVVDSQIEELPVYSGINESRAILKI